MKDAVKNLIRHTEADTVRKNAETLEQGGNYTKSEQKVFAIVAERYL